MMNDESNPLVRQESDPYIRFLHRIIIVAVKAMSLLMIFVIIASVVDVFSTVYREIISTVPIGVIHVEGILVILGAFIAVLIAIEIFNNIVAYLKEDSIQIKLVLSTALIAISRKVVVLDYKTTSPEYIYATAALVLATAIAYLFVRYSESKH